MERLWVVAPKALARAVRKELPDLQRGNLVLEPSPRDTAPAIALACETVARRDPEAVAAFFPTDHLVRDARAFAAAVRVAAAEARRGSLVCLGVRPDRPATGFGWIRLASPPRRGSSTPVGRFVEKPDLGRARRFLRSGRYLWNGGMFVGHAERFLEAIGRHAPRVLAAARHRGAWERAPKLSFDRAVLEKARGLRAVLLDAGWDDVGSWAAAARLRPGGDAPEVRRVASPRSAVFGGGRLVALVGVPDLVVVDTDDALLILDPDSAERVREVAESLRRERRREAR